MLNVIIEKELRDIISSMKFAISYGVSFLLIMLSFYVGAKGYLASRAEYDAARREDVRQMQGLTDWMSVRQHRIFLPPQPLAALVSGVSNDIGRTTEVRGRGELGADGSRFNDDPIYAVFRFLDLEFLFQVILSLFAIVFAYDAISGEKERGTLKLTFANAVPKDTYILGKLIGTFLALIVPLLVPIGIGCALLPMMGVPLEGGDWVKLLMVILTGVLYLLVFLSGSILVSVRTKRSSDSFLLMLVVWVFAVFIIPRAAVLVAGRAVDVPSVDEIASQKNRFNQQLFTEDRKTMSNYQPEKNDDPQKMMEAFNKFMQKVADDREQKMNEFAARLNEERTNKRRVQERWAFGLARISPAADLSLAVTELAGTSMDLKDRYHTAAQDYQKQYAAFIKSKTGLVPGGRVMIFMNDTHGKPPEPINPSELPEFIFPSQSVSQAGLAGAADMGVLGVFAVLAFVGAYLSFLRYDPR